MEKIIQSDGYMIMEKCEIKRQDGLRQVELVSLSELEVIENTIEYCKSDVFFV